MSTHEGEVVGTDLNARRGIGYGESTGCGNSVIVKGYRSVQILPPRHSCGDREWSALRNFWIRGCQSNTRRMESTTTTSSSSTTSSSTAATATQCEVEQANQAQSEGRAKFLPPSREAQQQNRGKTYSRNQPPPTFLIDRY